MDLEKVLEQLKAASTALEVAAKQSADHENRLVQVFGRVGTLDETMKAVKDQMATLENAIRMRGENVLPGMADEIRRNGQVDPVDALFAPNSRSFSIVREYTEKKKAAGGASPLQRDMTAGNDAAGAVFISSVMLPGYIDLIRERSLLWRASGGPRLTVFDRLSGSPVEIPTITGDVTVESVAENGAPTASDISTGMLKFEPRVLRALTKFSNRLLRLGSVASEAVRNSTVKQFALKMDSMGFRGKGSEKEPLGLVNTPGILSVAIGTNGGNFTLAVARKLKHKMRQNNQGQLSSAAYIGHPDVFYTAQAERIPQYSGDTAGEYLLLPISDANLQSMIGPYFDSTIFPTNLTKGSATTCTEVIYGNWEDLWLGLWEDLIFSVSNQTSDAFETSKTWVKAEMEYDFQVAQVLSFVLCNDALSVSL